MQRIKASSLNRGLVGAWCPSVAGDGLLLPDLSGYGNHGMLTNMDASDWVGTDRGRALDFDGVNDVVVVNNVRMVVGQGSFGGWFNNRTIVADTWHIGHFNSGSRLYIQFVVPATRYSLGIGDQDVAFGGTPIANKWTHLFGTYDSSTSKLFVDGVDVGSGARPGTLTSITGTFSFGALSAVNAGYSNLLWADARFYNRALSPSEIKQLYEGGPGYGLRQERKRSRFQVQGFNVGRFRRQQLIGTGVY